MLCLCLWYVFAIVFLRCVCAPYVIGILSRPCRCCYCVLGLCLLLVYTTCMLCCVSMPCTLCLSLCVSVPASCKCLYCVLCVARVGTLGPRWVRRGPFHVRWGPCRGADRPLGKRGRPCFHVWEPRPASPGSRLRGQSVRVRTSPQRVRARGRSAPPAQPAGFPPAARGGASACARGVAGSRRAPRPRAVAPRACARRAGRRGCARGGRGVGDARGRARARAGGAAGPRGRRLQWQGRRGPR